MFYDTYGDRSFGRYDGTCVADRFCEFFDDTSYDRFVDDGNTYVGSDEYCSVDVDNSCSADVGSVFGESDVETYDGIDCVGANCSPFFDRSDDTFCDRFADTYGGKGDGMFFESFSDTSYDRSDGKDDDRFAVDRFFESFGDTSYDSDWVDRFAVGTFFGKYVGTCDIFESHDGHGTSDRFAVRTTALCKTHNGSEPREQHACLSQAQHDVSVDWSERPQPLQSLHTAVPQEVHQTIVSIVSWNNPPFEEKKEDGRSKHRTTEGPNLLSDSFTIGI